MLRQSDVPGWAIQLCCIGVTSGALDPTAHSTSYPRHYQESYENIGPDPRGLILNGKGS